MGVIANLRKRLVLARLPVVPASDAEDMPDESSLRPQQLFAERAKGLAAVALVLEVGTKRVNALKATHSFALFPSVSRSNYIMADIEPGIDVDVVADLHALPQDWTQRFDAFVANAVFEHLERPWIAAKEVARVLKPGGFCYINTHQTFPIHGFPSDYFRYSKNALALIFEDAGMQSIEVAYNNRAMIIPPLGIVARSGRHAWNAKWPSYIHVNLLAEKP